MCTFFHFLYFLEFSLLVFFGIFTDIQAQFQEPMYRVQESVGNAIVTVTLNRQSSVPIPLIYSTISGTATGTTNLKIIKVDPH